MCDVWPQCLFVVVVLRELFDEVQCLALRLAARPILPTGPSETSELAPCCSFSNSLTTPLPHLLLRPLPNPIWFPLPLVCRSVSHHVESTVSPPPAKRIAIFSPARRCSFCCPRSLSAQLLCHYKSDLFRSSEPSVEVCGIIGWRRSIAKPMLDDLDSSRHSVFGLLTRQEAMVRLNDRESCSGANHAAADVTTVKVPEMAESITEGTLKQWSKREDRRCRTHAYRH